MNAQQSCTNASESERYQEEYSDKCQGPHRHRRYIGEYTREEGEVGISLLYIPLLQINSSKERKVMPMYEWVDDDEDY